MWTLKKASNVDSPQAGLVQRQRPLFAGTELRCTAPFWRLSSVTLICSVAFICVRFGDNLQLVSCVGVVLAFSPRHSMNDMLRGVLFCHLFTGSNLGAVNLQLLSGQIPSLGYLARMDAA